MPARDAVDPLAVLDPSARRAGPRVRVAVGAAVVLFVLAVALSALMSFGAGGGGDQERIEASAGGLSADASTDRASTVGAPSVLVHVLGAVARPGLVELAAGSRVVDAVAAAGGFAADADPAGVNLARPLVDGEQLAVPVVGQVPPSAAGGTAEPGTGSPPDGLVHLNSAGVAELDTLPRIGPALAQRIIDWRDANGPFTSVDQLLDVAGIGDTVFAGLEQLVAL